MARPPRGGAEPIDCHGPGRAGGGQRPRVAIDYTPAVTQGGGIGRYTRGLVAALIEHADRGAFDLRLVLARDAGLDRLPPLPEGVSLCRLPLPSVWMSRIWHRLRLPLAADRLIGGCELYHAPDYVLPPLARAQGLVTVHDLSFLTYPEGAVPALARYLGRAVPRSVARADRVLADSESTRRDLERLLGLAPDRVTVVGAGVEARFRPLVDRGQRLAARQRLGLPERFVLGLGTLEPRKNFVGLIQAFERCAERVPDLHLVIAGGQGWLFEPILEAAASSPHAARIHLLGFVDDAELPSLYGLAESFAFPSFYEGFGIPVLEAMACGTPVVVADNSSLPELAGDAALRVPTGDSAALATALLRLSEDPELRLRHARLGPIQASRFAWPAAADRLVEVYRGLLQR